MGNLGSIMNMLIRVEAQAIISSDAEEIGRAEKLILPGIGSFDNGMQRLHFLGLVPMINHKVLVERIPILGICLGMQLMTRNSEEGKLPGFGWVEAETVRFNFESCEQRLKIPHMGWNQVRIEKKSLLFKDMYDQPRFYFVHSYHVACHRPEDILTRTYYGREFTSAFQCDNIIGVQFHPEKSHKYGMKLFENFAKTL